jgi:diaminohydroxyphosphoribosylaminopyrimidine deaminase/5-amino-6-(5-phosphoribosylamino)uracil reductase
MAKVRTHPDSHWMKRALELASFGQFGASPNPLVGAVVLDKDGAKIGEGYHRAYGRAHAEVVALDEAGDDAVGGTLYVTLEPCAHHGKTPPCVEAILKAKIRRVVIALGDPNPVAAGGIVRLEEAGIEVDVGIGYDTARHLNRRWLKFVDRRTPWVTMKAAVSLDGRIATKTGHSKWITGPEAREHGRSLRENHDAILVGVDTVIADDPQLTRRLSLNPDTRLKRIILDSKLRTPLHSHIVRSQPELTLLAHTAEATDISRRAFAESGVGLIELPADEGGRVDLFLLMKRLGENNVSALLVEGGAQVHGSFADADLVDEAVFYIAPMIIGGNAPSAIAGLGVGQLEMAARFVYEDIDKLGDDMMLRAIRRQDDDVHGSR